jgi:pRiA4b ORF-3-like protein
MSQIIQLKITIRDSKPAIWRRVEVDGDNTFYQLHEIIQALFGWFDDHLKEFEIGRKRIIINDGMMDENEYDEANGFDVFDSSEIKLKDFLKTINQKLTYTYDFGDNWEHIIVVEKFLTKELGKNYPLCTKGKGRGPEEDCGGVWGYEELCEILSDKNHPEHEERMEWMGLEEGEFDPEYFNLEELNDDLRGLE